MSETLPPHESRAEQAARLAGLLEQYRDQRVVVVGTTCTGKSTFLELIEGAHDMDRLVFPRLSPDEIAAVDATPWTPEIGALMTRLTKERVQIEPGQPVFGTVVLDSDVIVYLHISDGLLQQRTAARGANFYDAKNMQMHIEEEIAAANRPTVRFEVG